MQKGSEEAIVCRRIKSAIFLAAAIPDPSHIFIVVVVVVRSYLPNWRSLGGTTSVQLRRQTIGKTGESKIREIK